MGDPEHRGGSDRVESGSICAEHMVSSDILTMEVDKSSSCCLIVVLEVIGHSKADVTVEVGLFCDGGNELPAIGSSTETVTIGACDESWKWETSCDDGVDSGVHGSED